MVVIRLARAGAKKNPFYHMVATDSRNRRDSSYVEKLGYFNPVARGQEVELHIDLEKMQYWQNVGAKLSDRVQALVKKFRKDNAIAQEPVAKKAVAKTKKLAETSASTPAKAAAKKTTASTSTKKAASKTEE